MFEGMRIGERLCTDCSKCENPCGEYQENEECLQTISALEEPLILKANHVMKLEDMKADEQYYNEKLHREVVIIDGRYDVIPPIK